MARRRNRLAMRWWERVLFAVCFLVTCGIFGFGFYCLVDMLTR